MSRQVNRRAAISRGFSLVEILVVCVIIAALSAGMYTFMAGKSKPGEKARSPLERGHDPVCISNLQQIRAALIMAQSNSENGKFPAKLSETKTFGVLDSMMSCPESHEPYKYDPETGEVHCVRAGHEKF